MLNFKIQSYLFLVIFFFISYPVCSQTKNINQAINHSLHWLYQNPILPKQDGLIGLLEVTIFYYAAIILDKNKTHQKYLHQKLQENSLELNKVLIQMIQNPRYLESKYTRSTLSIAAFILKEQGILNTYLVKALNIIQTNYFYKEEPIAYYVWSNYYICRVINHCSLTPTDIFNQSLTFDILNQNKLSLFLQKLQSSNNTPYILTTLYTITHDIFAITNFSRIHTININQIQFLNLNKLLHQGIQWSVTNKQWDLLGELIICATNLKIIHPLEGQKLIKIILKKQLSNGSWGEMNLNRSHKVRHGVLTLTMALMSLQNTLSI